MTVGDLVVKIFGEPDEESFKKAESFIGGFKSKMMGLLGAIGIGFGLMQMNALAEEFNQINDKITFATKGLGDAEETQQKILEAANRTKLSYGSMGEMVTKLVKTNKELFPIDDAIKFTELTSKLMMSAGKSEGEISSVQSQLTRVFQTGKVEGATLQRIGRQAPEMLNAVAKQLGVTTEALYQMGDSGALNAEKLKEAFFAAELDIEKMHGNLDYSISDAITSIRNSWGQFLDKFNSGIHLTQSIAKMLVSVFSVLFDILNWGKEKMIALNNALGGSHNLMKLLGMAAAALMIALSITQLNTIIAAFLKFEAALKGSAAYSAILNAQVLMIVGALLILFLIVEDFVGFLQGKKSLFGKILEKAGIDAEGARDKILGFFNGIKKWWDESGARIGEKVSAIFGKVEQIISKFVDVLVTSGAKLINSLIVLWGKHGDKIIAVAEIIGSIISLLIDTVFAGLGVIADVFGRVFGDALDIVFSVLGNLLDTVAGVLHGIIEVISSVIRFVAAIFSGDWAGAWSAFGDIVLNSIATVLTAVGGIVYTITDAFTGLISKAAGWGRDIIGGIIDGISGAAGRIGETISEVAGSIKKFIGFSEPEEGPLSDFHTYMPDMIDLMAEGIEGGKARISKAMDGLAGGMAEIAPDGLSDVVGGFASMLNIGNAQGGAMQAAGNVSKSIVQNVNIYNTFNGGDRSIQSQTANAMDSAAEDATGYMARALSFA